MQRRRGQTVTIYKRKPSVDHRGNTLLLVDETDPIVTRAALIPERSGRAEVPGQAQINVVHMVVAAGLPDLGLWAEVEWNGSRWDIVTPPAEHIGTRRTRHTSFDIRERP